jgi:ketosteroid isomerase-like protein
MDEAEMPAEPVEARQEPDARQRHDTSTEWLADRFEEQRPRLRSVAYRMLGSLNEADDAVQDTWLRVSRADASEVENLGAAGRAVVDAFFQAARGGDFDALVAVLDPDVVLRSDFGARRPSAPKVFHGAAAVANQALIGALPGAELHPALINGTAGVVITVHGRPFAVMGFTVAQGKIVEIDAIADPGRVEMIASSVLNDDSRNI